MEVRYIYIFELFYCFIAQVQLLTCIYMHYAFVRSVDKNSVGNGEKKTMAVIVRSSGQLGTFLQKELIIVQLK